MTYPPKDEFWPNDGGIEFFIDIYDWDRLIVSPSKPSILKHSIVLCVGYFPCKLTVLSASYITQSQSSYNSSLEPFDRAKLNMVGNGSISCLDTAGCKGLILQSLLVQCNELGAGAGVSPLQIGGIVRATIKDTSCVGCTSSSDGGSIRAYGGAFVTVNHSFFLHSYSSGVGGAICAIGANVHIVGSKFSNCTSLLGGGAVAADQYVCYSSRSAADAQAEVLIEWSLFEGCSSHRSGGAVIASSITTSVRILRSEFDDCQSQGAGGAVSVLNLAAVEIIASQFSGNSAGLPGGGALFADNGRLVLHGAVCTANSAPHGGGGALFWTGDSQPEFLAWCYQGFYSDKLMMCTPHNCKGLCRPCSKGTYQTAQGATDPSACLPCDAGTFSSSLASSVCISCVVGKYSSLAGATADSVCSRCSLGAYSSSYMPSFCVACSQGSFSPFNGSSGCLSCQEGSYMSIEGATSCVSCEAGEFSHQGADTCVLCDAGKYSSTGSSSCISCSPGSFSTANGAARSEQCSLCSAGTYSDAFGASFCSDCMAGTYNLNVGSNSTISCKPCADGAISFPGSSACVMMNKLRKGILFSLSANMDDVHIDLPFNFSIFCSEYSQSVASANGLLQFGFTELTGFTAFPVFVAADWIDSFLAPFWLSMTSGYASSFLEWRSSEEITLQWTNWVAPTVSVEQSADVTQDSSLSFQISLHSNGTISFCYPELTGPGSAGDQASIGIRGGEYWSFISCYTPFIYNQMCINFNPVPNRCEMYNVTTFPMSPYAALIPLCPPGKYLSSSVVCNDCAAGKYQTGTGAVSESSCVACLSGTYSTAVGADRPESCIGCNLTLSRDCISNNSDAFLSPKQFNRMKSSASNSKDTEISVDKSSMDSFPIMSTTSKLKKDFFLRLFFS